MSSKIGFMASLDYKDMPAKAVCESLAKLGYEAVEWTLSHFNPRTKSREDLKELVRVSKDCGLTVSEVVVQQDLVCHDEGQRRERINLVLECIEAAEVSGISIINVFTGPAFWDPTAPKVGRDLSEGAAWDIVFKAYELFVKAAEKYKVNLAVEGVLGMLCHDYYTTRVLIDKFDSPLLGVNFDPSHDILAGNFDVGWIIRQWGKNRIKHVHLKDAVGVQRMGRFLFPIIGEGNVNWKEFFTAMDEIGYDGYMSVEFESFNYYKQILNNDPEAAAAISMEHVKKLLI